MIFSCSNASIEGIYFNKKITFKGLSKKVFFLATHPPQLPCSAVEPPNNTAKAEWWGIETVTVWGQMQCGLGTWVHPPTVTPSQNKMVLSPSAWLCQAWHQGLPQVAHFLHTQLVHSPVHFSSLCRKVSLSCNPKKIQTHTCEIWRNHWSPKESIKLYFSLSHVCERHLFPLSLPWEISMFPSTPWQYSWAPHPLLLLPFSASVQMWASPACNGGYRTRPSVLRCVQLYISGVLVCNSEHPCM